jgi:GNAT superfamily N-acetyltransferase
MAVITDVHGEQYRVVHLTLAVATDRAREIVELHNSIPNQHWGIQQVLAEQDDTRIFHAKWSVSRIAVDTEDKLVGFCIAFERTPDSEYYPEKCFYLHRLAILPESRGRGLGALLQTQTIVDFFLRGFQCLGSARDPVIVYGQTDSAPFNRNVVLFNRASGFVEVGQKPYPFRTDLIMRADAKSFWDCRHVAFWRSHRWPGY